VRIGVFGFGAQCILDVETDIMDARLNHRPVKHDPVAVHTLLTARLYRF
jgi:hypothetical protein